MSFPKYGIVQWADAAGVRKRKLRLDKLTKELPIRESLGWIMVDKEGTVAVIHDHVLEDNGNLRRDVEFTIIPSSWITKIIPLTIDEKFDNGIK
jgi:hypothetical protein